MKNIPWSPDRKEEIHVLMIGNSFCYFYLDQLYGMARAAGIESRISSVVAGACTLKQHWTWLEAGEKHYNMITADRTGRSEVTGMSLEDCLAQDSWHVISYQNGGRYIREGGLANAQKHQEPYLGNLVRYTRERFPDTDHLFLQAWAYQIGYEKPGVYKVTDRAAQQELHRGFQTLALDAVRDHGLLRVPAGDAWELARQNPAIGDTLCMPDLLHDGQTGGQYLNACVWFEVLFGISCVGNTYRPDYPLSEERIAALQEAAHAAVQAAL